MNDGRQYELRVDLFDWEGEHRYAKYSHFYVETEPYNYRVRISGYTGNADGDSFGSLQNGQQFRTVDDDSFACGAGGGGFWCSTYYVYVGTIGHGGFLPNGRYSYNSSVPYGSGLHWMHWRGLEYSLKAVSMIYRATN